MREEYEQMEFDTRSDLKRGVAGLTGETISMVQTMITNCGEAPAAVRNRHEAYGIAAEHLASITAIVKSIKNDCGTLLGYPRGPELPRRGGHILHRQQHDRGGSRHADRRRRDETHPGQPLHGGEPGNRAHPAGGTGGRCI